MKERNGCYLECGIEMCILVRKEVMEGEVGIGVGC